MTFSAPKNVCCSTSIINCLPASSILIFCRPTTEDKGLMIDRENIICGNSRTFQVKNKIKIPHTVYATVYYFIVVDWIWFCLILKWPKPKKKKTTIIGWKNVIRKPSRQPKLIARIIDSYKKHSTVRGLECIRHTCDCCFGININHLMMTDTHGRLGAQCLTQGHLSVKFEYFWVPVRGNWDQHRHNI